MPLYGAQTQRAVDNFGISDLTMPRRFIEALGLIKAATAEANRDLGDLDSKIAEAIIEAAEAVAGGAHDAHFPVDVFQTGSGTSSNMNANEVIANLASQGAGETVHPNDHVNMAQSSNDVIPTAIHVSAAGGLCRGTVTGVELPGRDAGSPCHRAAGYHHHRPDAFDGCNAGDVGPGGRGLGAPKSAWARRGCGMRWSACTHWHKVAPRWAPGLTRVQSLAPR